jgi:hypothetical protein
VSQNINKIKKKETTSNSNTMSSYYKKKHAYQIREIKHIEKNLDLNELKQFAG